MKKIFLTLLTLLLITGCGTKSPMITLDEASKNMKELDNYEMKMDISMEVTYNGQKMGMTTSSESIVDEKNNKTYVKTNSKVFAIETTTEAYHDLSGDKMISYVSDGKQWTKEIGTKEETKMFDLFTKERTIEETKTTKGDKAYKLTLTAEELKELTGDTDINSTSIKDIDLIIETKGKYIKLMSFAVPVTDSGMTMNADFTITFDKYNEASNVIIPQSVIDEAK